jgi:hypothetical protein
MAEAPATKDLVGAKDFASIYGRAPAAKIEIDLMADEVAGMFGGNVAKAPIKSEARTLQKSWS